MRVVFTVFAEPVGKARARTVTHGGITRSYTPKKSANYEQLIRHVAQPYAQATGLLQGPLTVKVLAFRSPRKTSQKQVKLMLEGTIRPDTRPDCDNYAKSVLDALNGLLWKDDAQVVNLIVEKYYGDPPRIEIEIETLPAPGE